MHFCNQPASLAALIAAHWRPPAQLRCITAADLRPDCAAGCTPAAAATAHLHAPVCIADRHTEGGGSGGAAALQTQPQMRAKRACQRVWPRCLPA